MELRHNLSDCGPEFAAPFLDLRVRRPVLTEDRDFSFELIVLEQDVFSLRLRPGDLRLLGLGVVVGNRRASPEKHAPRMHVETAVLSRRWSALFFGIAGNRLACDAEHLREFGFFLREADGLVFLAASLSLKVVTLTSGQGFSLGELL